jgi:hypothetical protein
MSEVGCLRLLGAASVSYYQTLLRCSFRAFASGVRPPTSDSLPFHRVKEVRVGLGVFELVD